MKQILIVEDDISLARGISLALQKENLQCQIAESVSRAKHLLEQEGFALILLDINLPDGSGLTFCKGIKKESKIPVIFLTANDMEYDEVAGLEAGADDYITKPFHICVLRARVKAVLRREESFGSSEYFSEDGYVFDFAHRHFERAGEELLLSKTEQKVLRILTANKGRTVARDILLDRVWSDSGEYVDENALSVVIRRLRTKLEYTPAKPEYIQTIYGLGYSWTKEKHGREGRESQ